LVSETLYEEECSMLQRMNAWFFPTLSVVTALVIVGCASTRLIDQWHDEAYSNVPLKKVLVIATAESDLGRRTFEDSFVRALRASNTEAVAGYTLLPGDIAINKESISKAIEGKGFDAVLITSHERTDKKTVYVPGEVRTEVSGYGYPYARPGWDLYNQRVYRTIEQPGYYDEQSLVYLETNLFEAREGALIWSARTETVNPSSVQDLATSLSKLVIKNLRKDGFLVD